MNAQPQPITRADLEGKMRELQSGVTETREQATNMLVTAGAVVGIVVLAVAFLLGRRSGTKRTTVVEVRRI